MKILSPKLTYSFLGLVGLAALVLGFVNLSRTIASPGERANLARQEVVSDLASRDAARETYLRTQDTDRDGLTDYEELTILGTSPYLADSDSDGFTDKQEIDSEHDPNCPRGQNCRSFSLPEQVQAETGLDLELGGFGELLNQASGITNQESAQTEIDLTKLTAEEIRELLVESGEISLSQLEQIDDETLLEVYKEVLGGGIQ